MSNFCCLLLISIILIIFSNINAIPLASNAIDIENTTTEYINGKNSTSIADATQENLSNGESTNSDNKPTAYVLPSNVDPSLYADYLTPELIQQYVQQFGNTLPAFIYSGYTSPPSSSTPAAHTTEAPTTGQTAINPCSKKSNNLRNRKTQTYSSISQIIHAIVDFFPPLLDFSLFRVLIAVASVAVSILMSNFIVAAFCNLTMLCSAGPQAIDYSLHDITMKHFEDPELKAERVRRASNFLSNAIYKYKSPNLKTKNHQRFEDKLKYL